MECKKCGRGNLGPDDFQKDKRTKTGFRYQCKDCQRARSKEYRKRYYERNRERMIEYAKGHYRRNRQKAIDYQMARYFKKKEEKT